MRTTTACVAGVVVIGLFALVAYSVGQCATTERLRIAEGYEQRVTTLPGSGSAHYTWVKAERDTAR